MAVKRIRVAKDKADLVTALTESEGKTGPFQTYADVILFAATLGSRRQKRIPLGEISQREPAPISLEVFISRGYDWVIKLLAVAEVKNTDILNPTQEAAENQRILIFEEYANGGLEILREELRGAVDYAERILLMLSVERNQEEKINEEFDLRRFLT